MNIHIPRDLIHELRSAQHIAILTGAGTSAESGVPTFREAQTGLWAKYDPQELASPQAFKRQPDLVWDWYAWRRSIVMDAKPNAGHFAIAQMENHVPTVTLITQNVDGFHQQAGSTRVLELHGNIMRTKCSSCAANIERFDDSENKPPRCPICQDYLRPDVVWFGENLPQQVLGRAFTAVQECDLFFSVGTSAVVHPAASLPVEALQRGISVVEINPERTPISSYMTYVLSGPSGVILPELVDQVWPT
jgi:NAD-dependent deacetylase